MIWLALRKLGGLLATLLVAAAVIYLVLELAPLRAASGPSGWQGFLRWLGGLATGNFGVSISSGQPIGPLVGAGLAVTLPLIVFAAVIALIVGVPAGLVAARRPESRIGKTLAYIGTFGSALAPFWIGMVLVLTFALTLRWLPPGGFVPWSGNPLGALTSLLLPALALGLPQAAAVGAVTARAVSGAEGAAWFRGTMARGLTAREAFRRHGLRNALLPLLASAGLQLSALIAGSVIVETVFYLPGLGRLVLDGVALKDPALIRGALFALVAFNALALFAADLLRSVADPRMVPEQSA